MKEIEDYCKALIMLDGGKDWPVIAFIEEDGSFGGCSVPNYFKEDKRYKEGMKYKLTTNGKYTRWACGLIKSDEL